MKSADFLKAGLRLKADAKPLMPEICSALKDAEKGAFATTLACVLLATSLIMLSGCSKNNPVSSSSSDGVWSSFHYPTARFIDTDSTGYGKYFTDYIPDPDTLIRSIALQDCKQLYHNPSEVPTITLITLYVDSMGGVAYTTGTNGFPTARETHFSGSYLGSVITSRPQSAAIFEIEGVIAHEETHIWQQNCDYGTTDGYGVIEGEADAVRYLTGHDSISRRQPGGTWTDGYTTTGFFIVWIQQNSGLDKNFLYDLNQYVGKHFEFSWDAACMSILNKHVQDLWNLYQKVIGG